jgi:hypothetical protein
MIPLTGCIGNVIKLDFFIFKTSRKSVALFQWLKRVEYALEDKEWIPGRDSIFSSTQRPNRQWGPPNLVSNGYQGIFMLD